MLSIAEDEDALALSLILVEMSFIVDPLFSELVEVCEIEGMINFLGEIVVNLAVA